MDQVPRLSWSPARELRLSADYEAAFFQTILDAPDDDTPRLIFADWLEERGESERAQLIRVQCELARLPADNPRHPQYAEWKACEQALLRTHEREWAAPLARLVNGWEFRRGFIDAVTMTVAAFLDHGEQLFKLTPVTHVRFLDSRYLLPVLADCPALSRLRRVQFFSHYLDDAALPALAASPHLRQLVWLHLGKNNLTNRGVGILANSPNLAALQYLNLSANFISRAGARILAAGGTLPALTAVDLSNNLIDLEGVAALRQRFGDNLVCFGQGSLSQLGRLVEFLERQGVPQGTEGYPELPLERLEHWLSQLPSAAGRD
ncbi:MAG: TIGR02996 domain-containing protein [Planctomycetia bacterium]|nr:TIGR02996 domain-containing protein [Planctomycetia bacterium]